MPPERQLWLTLLLGLLALAAPAAAQDYLGEPNASNAFSWPRRAANATVGQAEPALDLASRDEGRRVAAMSARSFLEKSPSALPSALNRFTRLAGMFMGRVSPLSLGSVRICFKIDIQ